MSRATLNITFIHIFEVIVVLLVVGKLFQIRKLYIQSILNRQAESVNRRHSLRQMSVSQSNTYMSFGQHPAKKMFKDASGGFSRHNLPLPEVSFTDGLPLPEVSYLSENDFSVANEPAYSKNKTALNSYIDDMFFESTYEFVEEPTPFKLKSHSMQSQVDDEFIIVAEENAQLVRELQRFNKRVSFAR